MKSICCLVCTLMICNGILFAQNRSDAIFSGCGTDLLMNSNPALLNAQSRMDNDIYKYLTKGAVHNSLVAQTYTIPVVVHIIHNGGTENISDAQVQNAIAHINAKYAQNNGDQIQFCLAQRDPNGNATTGITRDQSTLTTETMEVDDITLKNINRWAPTCYLNIWVIKEILSISQGSGVVGYAYFPSSYGTNVDGLVIEANYFGSSAANDAVGTHEIGHYFGLYHTFQNGCGNNDCLLDGDHVCDTPPDQTTFASCNPPTNSCSTDADDHSANNPFTTDVNDNSEDYMDYSAISCYTNFTPGQYTRMLYFLSTVRYPLLACRSCQTPCPNPLTATITTPASALNITTGNTVNFSGTATNAGSYQWFLTPGVVLGTGLSVSYTFNTMGSYWMKFKAISGNSSLCNDAIDSILIEVTQPVVASCSGSINLNPVNSALRLPLTNQNYSSNGFTWECWFKLDTSLSNNTSTRPLINQADETPCEDILLGFGWFSAGTHDHLIFRVDGPNGCAGVNPVMNDYVPPGGFVLGNWYHAAGVMDYANHRSKIFLNGQLVSSLANNAAPITRVAITEVSCDALTKKQNYPGPPLGGEVDEVRVWNKARTDADILANYNTCLTGNEDHLLYYYRCNQSAGSMATDASVNHTNATLYNGASWSTQQHALTVNNCPDLRITVNSATICSGSSAVLAASGAAGYTWSPPTGLNITTGDTVTASPVITTTYTVTGTNVCDTTTAEAQVVVNTIGTKTPDLGNDISLCTSGTHTFHAGSGFEKYTWQDGSTDSIFTAFRPGKYWVTVKNFCSLLNLSDTVSINVTPSPSLDLGTDITICQGDTTPLAYTSNGIYTSFLWSPDTAINCTICPNPSVHPAATAKYYLTATTPDGCTNNDSVYITVNSCNLPVSNFAASGVSLCANDCISFTNNSVNSTSWLWKFEGANPGSSTDQNPHDVCYLSAGTFSVSLVAYNSHGNNMHSSNNYITVKPAPLSPVITHRHDTLTCNYDPIYTSYQWTRNNSVIQGATDTILIISQGGDYNVSVKNEYGCSIGSGIHIIIDGISTLSENDPVSISFNPVNDELYIHSKRASGEGTISIYNALGEKMMWQQFKQEEKTLVQLREFSAGIYFVQIRENERQFIQKIIIQ